MKPLRKQAKIERPKKEKVTREEALKRVKHSQSGRRNSLPLSEKVRIELFIPDLPDPLYFNLLERLGDEWSYAFRGCTVVPASG
ncbi:MAG TPA: hypothetical protein VLU47_05410, partial [Blastocatellia bacterium]|nr:hypothetical protein [Blastocatellia bacterium]